MSKAILALNSGSSSVKFTLFQVEDGSSNPESARLILKGLVDGIGTNPHFVATDTSKNVIKDTWWHDSPQDRQTLTHADLLPDVIKTITTFLGDVELSAVGHRIVHGGARYNRPTLITDEVISYLDSITPFAPLHQPGGLASIRALKEFMPDLMQVACFDTAFHHTMPDVAKRFALPRRYFDQEIRRYGFHGLSYEYITRYLQKHEPELAKGRVVIAHLGNGASLAAVHDGKCLDTSMSFTALDGLMMGTRPGIVDPGVLLYMMSEEKLSAKDIEKILYHQSGLLGVSGVSNDFRVLLEEAQGTGEKAQAVREAMELFDYRLVAQIGSMIAVLGGIDALVFTAGVGEYNPQIREAVCRRLSWVGIDFDEQANQAKSGPISTPSSKVKVMVIPTDEEATIVGHVLNMQR